jgi:hypothetical protein
MAYLEKYSDEHYVQARILNAEEPLVAAPPELTVFALACHKYAAPAELRS